MAWSQLVLAAAHVARLLLVGSAVGAAILIGGLTQRGLDRYLHPPHTLPTRTPADVGLAYRDAQLLTEDGLLLAAWFVPGSRPDSVILVHGLGSNRADLLELAADLHERGFCLLLVDLRAHGQSEGQVSSLGVNEVRDIRATLGFLRAQPEVAMDRISIYGISLGGAVALQAAAVLPELRAVAVDSTFASARWVVDHQLHTLLNLPDWFGGLLLEGGRLEAGVDPDQAAPMTAASHLGQRPLLVIHGVEDEMFLVDNARMIYAAASGPGELWLLEGVGHGGAYSRAPVDYVQRLAAVFSRH